jgi:cytochrome c553
VVGISLLSINTGGALNDGLVSDTVGGEQYVAATVGGGTENPSTVAGPLRVVVYGLHDSGEPEGVMQPRLQPPSSPGHAAGEAMYQVACSQCHGPAGGGSSAPPFTRQSKLADPALLKQFLATVRPPMPRLYPGALNDDDVKLLAAYLKTDVFHCGPGEPQSCEPPAKPTTCGQRSGAPSIPG